jgi:hypothetical protein
MVASRDAAVSGSRVPRAHTGDRDVDKAVNAIGEELAELRRTDPSLGGILHQAVRISDTDVTVLAHKLGRAYQGWRVHRVYPAATLTTPGFILEDDTSRRATHLALRSVGFDAPVFVDLFLW